MQGVVEERWIWRRSETEIIAEVAAEIVILRLGRVSFGPVSELLLLAVGPRLDTLGKSVRPKRKPLCTDFFRNESWSTLMRTCQRGTEEALVLRTLENSGMSSSPTRFANSKSVSLACPSLSRSILLKLMSR